MVLRIIRRSVATAGYESIIMPAARHAEWRECIIDWRVEQSSSQFLYFATSILNAAHGLDQTLAMEGVTASLRTPFTIIRVSTAPPGANIPSMRMEQEQAEQEPFDAEAMECDGRHVQTRRASGPAKIASTSSLARTSLQAFSANRWLRGGADVWGVVYRHRGESSVSTSVDHAAGR